MTLPDVIGWLGSAAFATVAVALVNAFLTRKKLGAEAHRTDAETSRTDAETDRIITETARGLVADMREEAIGRSRKVERLESRVGDLERERDANRTKISSLERQVEAMIRDRDEVVQYVGNLRVWAVAGAKPPPPPVPKHLRDVIPEWAPDDQDRTTDRPAPTTDEDQR